MTQNVKDNLRWLIILPASFLCSLLTIVLLMFIAMAIESNINNLNPNLLASMLSIGVVSVWIFTAYFIAPKHKEKTVWLFYFIGCLIASGLAFFVYEESHAREEKIMTIVFLSTSIIYGLLISLKLQKRTSIIEFIDREIKTTYE